MNEGTLGAGSLVEAQQVDFSDLISLYKAILSCLSYELPVFEDEPTTDDLADRVVEALGVYTCLIVIDDLDSLSPEEQKETVAAIVGIAQRTVGRDIPPSRVLLTSRIDQGLPATGVVKLSGLERDAFPEYVENVCRAFQIPPIPKSSHNALFEATSGSPLFAASVIRLVKLGESLNTVLETWRGQEGEEVRRFAFEREIKRLGNAEGRLLFAVMLLGETSLRDLASVLDITERVVRDQISELQAYHLIATATKETGDTVIFAPADLVSVLEILRSHLGPLASTVAQACKRAEERSAVASKSIGLGIRNVITAWDTSKYDQAVLIAQELRKRFPESGDVASILGASLLKTLPPRFGEADRELDAARKLKCKRPELLGNVIKAKTGNQDWLGLYDITRHLISSRPSRDSALLSFLIACRQLIAVARGRGDLHRIEELAMEAIQRGSSPLKRYRLERSYADELTNQLDVFGREYLNAIDRRTSRASEKLEVFRALSTLDDYDLLTPTLVRLGVGALRSWWDDVEGRSVVDRNACSILSRELRRLEKFLTKAQDEGWADAALVELMTKLSRDLAFRAAKLVA